MRNAYLHTSFQSGEGITSKAYSLYKNDHFLYAKIVQGGGGGGGGGPTLRVRTKLMARSSNKW